MNNKKGSFFHQLVKNNLSFYSFKTLQLLFFRFALYCGKGSFFFYHSSKTKERVCYRFQCCFYLFLVHFCSCRSTKVLLKDLKKFFYIFFFFARLPKVIEEKLVVGGISWKTAKPMQVGKFAMDLATAVAA